MTDYQHRKGVIRDNALEALLHDPLFKVRIEKNHKGKGSFRRKEKHANKNNWEATSKADFTRGLLLSDDKNRKPLIVECPTFGAYFSWRFFRQR